MDWDNSYFTMSDENNSNIAIYTPEDDEEIPFLNQSVTEDLASFSPDGKWLAYMSDESGAFEVYVRPYPGPGGKWQISADGGLEPRWSHDGRELFFRNDRQILAARIDPGRGFRAERPRVVLEGLPAAQAQRTYALAPDRESILMIEPVSRETDPEKITIVTNWFSKLHGQEGFLP